MAKRQVFVVAGLSLGLFVATLHGSASAADPETNATAPSIDSELLGGVGGLGHPQVPVPDHGSDTGNRINFEYHRPADAGGAGESSSFPGVDHPATTRSQDATRGPVAPGGPEIKRP